MALQAVQRSLRQQSKPAIQISEKTLIAQLEAEGLLLDRANRPIAPGQSGGKSRQVRIDRKRVRVIRMKLDDLLGSDGEALRGGPARQRKGRVNAELVGTRPGSRRRLQGTGRLGRLSPRP